MLSTAIFFIREFFFQTINYFSNNNLVEAAESNSQIVLTPLEIIRLNLSACVNHKVYENSNNLLYLGDKKYVSLGTFDRRFNKIGLLKEKLSKGILEVHTITNRDDGGIHILQDVKKNVKFVFSETSQNTNYFQVYIEKNDFDEILETIKKTSNHHDKSTLLLLNLPMQTNICLLQICSSANGNLRMYSPLENVYMLIPISLLTTNLCIYLENYKVMYTIKLLKRVIDENSSNTFKIDDELNLHIDEMPIVSFYTKTSTPTLVFFEEFNINLKPFDERYPEREGIINFKCKPSILIEFSKMHRYSPNYINFQIIEYKYSDTDDTYSCLNKNSAPSYCKINFESDPAIISELDGIFLHTTIEKLKTTPILKMYFDKEGLLYEPEVYETLKNSINKVIISTYGGGSESNTINHKFLEINNEDKIFSIKLNHTIFSDEELSPIKSIVKKRDGVFRIAVQNGDAIIIDITICLNDNIMVVISSNRLGELFSKTHIKNVDTSSTTPIDISNKDSTTSARNLSKTSGITTVDSSKTAATLKGNLSNAPYTPKGNLNRASATPISNSNKAPDTPKGNVSIASATPISNSNKAPDTPKGNVSIASATATTNSNKAPDTTKGNVSRASATPTSNSNKPPDTPKGNVSRASATPTSNSKKITSNPKGDVSKVSAIPKGNVSRDSYTATSNSNKASAFLKGNGKEIVNPHKIGGDTSLTFPSDSPSERKSPPESTIKGDSKDCRRNALTPKNTVNTPNNIIKHNKTDSSEVVLPVSKSEGSTPRDRDYLSQVNYERNDADKIRRSSKIKIPVFNSVTSSRDHVTFSNYDTSINPEKLQKPFNTNIKKDIPKTETPHDSTKNISNLILKNKTRKHYHETPEKKESKSVGRTKIILGVGSVFLICAMIAYIYLFQI